MLLEQAQMSSTRIASILALEAHGPRRAVRANVAAWLLAAPLAVAACTQPGGRGECVGALLITVPLASTPAKLRVELRRSDRADVSVVDECSGASSPMLVERQTGKLIVDDGGFGYTPPPRFDLTVTDLGTCTGTATTVVAVEDVEVAAGLGVCDFAEVTLAGN
jgi:hypothetical protein